MSDRDQFVYEYDSSTHRGYLVRVWLSKTAQHARWFSVRKHGDWGRAKAAARQHRDALLVEHKIVPWAERGGHFKWRESYPGVPEYQPVGINLMLTRANGTARAVWRAGFGTRSKTFAIDRYGYANAFGLACETRSAAIGKPIDAPAPTRRQIAAQLRLRLGPQWRRIIRPVWASWWA